MAFAPARDDPLTSTGAPPTPAPVESLTVPARPPVVSWANSAALVINRAVTAKSQPQTLGKRSYRISCLLEIFRHSESDPSALAGFQKTIAQSDGFASLVKVLNSRESWRLKTKTADFARLPQVSLSRNKTWK